MARDAIESIETDDVDRGEHRHPEAAQKVSGPALRIPYDRIITRTLNLSDLM